MFNKLYLPLKKYKKKYIKSDFVAALVVTSIAIPESLGFAIIVGVPIQVGLYCALAAPIVFALMTSSRRLIVGADSATAALVAAGASTVAVAGTGAYASALAVLGIITGVILLIMALFRLGFLADLISRPVLIGFLAGVGVQLLIHKFPEMLGIETSGNFLNHITGLFENIGEIHVATAVLSLTTLAIIIVAGRRGLPGALFGLFAATFATFLFDLQKYGIHTVGAIPEGFPSIILPSIDPSHVVAMLPSAIAIAMVILAQSLTVIRSSAAKFEEKTKDNQDLMSLGMANLASAFTGGFAINGSPPRTTASEISGGRSQMVNIFMAGFVGIVLLFASAVFIYMPTAALAAVVFSIGLHLVKIQDLNHVWRTRREEWYVAIIALIGVAVLGVQQGVLVAVIVSLLERLRRQYNPSDIVLLRDREMDEWLKVRIPKQKSTSRHPAGLLIYRFSGSIFFENSTYFLNRATKVIDDAKQPVKTFVVDVGAVDDIDYTAAEMLRRLHAKLNRDDIQLVFAHVSPSLLKVLKSFDMIELIGQDNIYPSIASAIRAFPGSRKSVEGLVAKLKLAKRDYIVIGGGVMELSGIRNTNDVDLVVSNRAYRHLRSHGWKEFKDDAGKKTLSKPGYQVMRSWMGKNLSDLKKNQFMHNNIPCMSLEDLVVCKERMGRDKDIADIALIKKHMK